MLWPAAHKDTVRMLWGAIPAAEIAKFLNATERTSYTKNAVIGLAHRMDLPLINSRQRRAWSKNRKAPELRAAL